MMMMRRTRISVFHLFAHMSVTPQNQPNQSLPCFIIASH
jgi:hypothetical protein